jgi:hypothetical protein
MMWKQLIGIMFLMSAHFAALAFAVESGRTGVAEVLAFPLVYLASWLGIMNSAAAWSLGFLNSLFCGTLAYFAIAALARRRPTRRPAI